jgi:DNA-binding response OmpR family regulator
VAVFAHDGQGGAEYCLCQAPLLSKLSVVIKTFYKVLKGFHVKEQKKSRDERKTLLIVDDSPVFVDLVKYAVNTQGTYQVMVAYDGVQGLEVIYQKHPDCVIVDVKMPRLDGYQLVRALRGDPRTENMPVIMLSVMSRQEDQMQGLLAGADEYLTKPFKPTELHAAIVRAMSKHDI